MSCGCQTCCNRCCGMNDPQHNSLYLPDFAFSFTSVHVHQMYLTGLLCSFVCLFVFFYNVLCSACISNRIMSVKFIIKNSICETCKPCYRKYKLNTCIYQPIYSTDKGIHLCQNKSDKKGFGII